MFVEADSLIVLRELCQAFSKSEGKQNKIKQEDTVSGEVIWHEARLSELFYELSLHIK